MNNIITKAFETKKEVQIFKKEYEENDINTEVISNLLQPSNNKKFPEIENYCNFWWPLNNQEDYKNKGILQFMIVMFGSQALKDTFGTHDFTFKGNRKYENYILNFKGLTIIAPDKRSVVLTKNKNFTVNLIEFEYAYAQLVIDFIHKNYVNLKDYEKHSFDILKNNNLIDQNGKIFFPPINNTIPYLKP